MHARTLPGSPEGTRVRTSNGRPLSAGLSAILALLSLSFAVAIGGAAGSLTVENQTTHVVNVVIGDQTFANVAPGAEAVYRSGAAGTVNVTVSYASGQGVQGSAQRSFQFGSAMVPGSQPHPYGTAWSCAVNAPITGGGTGLTINWRVTGDMLSPP